MNVAAEQVFFAKLDTHIPQVTRLVYAFLFVASIDSHMTDQNELTEKCPYLGENSKAHFLCTSEKRIYFSSQKAVFLRGKKEINLVQERVRV